jgi:hypothetical protein
MQLSFLNLGKL